MGSPSTVALRAPSLLRRYRGEIQAELRAIVESTPAVFTAQVGYQMGWLDERGRSAPVDAGGKLLRPSLLLLACDGLGGERDLALPLAAALEFVHNFSLVHDDIQDGDRERRHRPTAWALWGVPQGVNLGDALFSLGMSALHGSLARGLSPARVLQAQRTLAAACLEMIEGQYMDLSFEKEPDVSLSSYLVMAERKTGALMGCALEMGALAAEGTDAQVAAFRRAGRGLGLAFQARDDCLAIWGDHADTGKSVGNDIMRKKKSLPVVYGLARAPAAQTAQLRRVYAQPSLSADDVALARDLLAAAGARSFARDLAEERCRAALAELASAGLSRWAQEEFSTLVAYLLDTQRE